MNEITPILKLYENMQAVLENAALYSAKITHFSAGGLGACAYSDDISAGELARCWQHEEYQTTCPHCGGKSYITYWAGHVNGGGYWEIGLFCPQCKKEIRLPRPVHHHIHWTKMREILREERDAIQQSHKQDDQFDEIARVGFIGEHNELEVFVRTDDTGSVPHFHVRDHETKGEIFEACVELFANRYFHHEHLSDVLSSSQRTLLAEFMESPNDYFPSNYEATIYAWNANNETRKVEVMKDERGNVIIPDYCSITEYCDDIPFIHELKYEVDSVTCSHQCDVVVEKFTSLHPKDVTIILLSDNDLGNHMAEMVTSKCKDTKMLDGVVCKLTTEEVDDIVLVDRESAFRKHYGEDFVAAYHRLCNYLDDMDEKRNGTFSRNLILDDELKEVLDFTLKVSTDRYAEFANVINDRDLLIIGDTTNPKQSIDQACNIIRESYAPKSITVLSLYGQLDEMARINLNEPRGAIFPYKDYDVHIRSNDKEPARLHIITRDWDVEFYIANGELYKVKKKGKDEKVLKYIKDNVPKWLNSPCTALPSITNQQNANLQWVQLHPPKP